MKKIVWMAFCVCSGTNFVFAQTAPKVLKVKPVAPVLKTTSDSFNYALGMNIANNLKQQNIDKVNGTILQKGMNDAFANKPLLLDENQANTVIQSVLKESKNKKANAQKAIGKKFLEANGKRKGVTTLPSGVQYEVIRAGADTGASPKPNDQVVAHYAGTLIDGTDFDNSYKRGTPLTIGVSSVIAGWTEVLQLMHVGDKWKVFIPSEQGYGDFGSGPKIPGGATLIFEMELLEIKPSTAPVQPQPGN
jgi:FKBP-type peptidyl-prolyl cis-trans isomerase FklB